MATVKYFENLIDLMKTFRTLSDLITYMCCLLGNRDNIITWKMFFCGKQLQSICECDDHHCAYDISCCINSEYDIARSKQ